jgi:hypothetical protein
VTVDIDKLEALEKAATPRPWLIKASELTWVGPDSRARHYRIIYPTPKDECSFEDSNAEFIATIRNALPELLAEVRRLRQVEKWAGAYVDALLDQGENSEATGEAWDMLNQSLCTQTE